MFVCLLCAKIVFVLVFGVFGYNHVVFVLHVCMCACVCCVCAHMYVNICCNVFLGRWQ